MTQPIQAVQIYFEHPFGAEREVLREFFSFAGCLVKTTMIPVETMLEKHKSLVNPGSERITHLFLTDRLPEGIVLSKNEIWCSFRILKRELTINGKAILCNADQKISAKQFEKAALDAIIHRIWKDDEAATQSLLHINTSFWQLDLFEFLQIKSTFQALKMGELMALPMRGHYYLPEAVYLNKMADAFINIAKQCSVGAEQYLCGLCLCKCTATFTRTPCIVGNTCSAAYKIICCRRASTKAPFGIEQNLSYRAKLRVNVLSSGSTVRRTGTVCT